MGCSVFVLYPSSSCGLISFGVGFAEGFGEGFRVTTGKKIDNYLFY